MCFLRSVLIGKLARQLRIEWSFNGNPNVARGEPYTENW